MRRDIPRKVDEPGWSYYIPQMTQNLLRRRKLISQKKHGAKVLGVPFTIAADGSDLVWPTHCPVLGLTLEYEDSGKGRGIINDARASFDRHDNTKGYVPGNVNIISWRANKIKLSYSVEELRAVSVYAEVGLW